MILIFYIITSSYVLIRQDMNKIGLIKVELLNGISINFKIKIYTAFKFLVQMFNGILLSVIQTKN